MFGHGYQLAGIWNGYATQSACWIDVILTIEYYVFGRESIAACKSTSLLYLIYITFSYIFSRGLKQD